MLNLSISHKNRRINLFLLTILVTFFTSTWCKAADTNTEENLPIEITAENLIAKDIKGQSVYTGNVVIVQGTTRITGDKVTLFHPNRKLSHAIIIGQPATFKRFLKDEQKWVNGHAKKITYHTQKKTVLLEREAFIEQEGKNSLEAPKILYNTQTKTLEAKGNKEDKQRIKMTFQPEEEDNDS